MTFTTHFQRAVLFVLAVPIMTVFVASSTFAQESAVGSSGMHGRVFELAASGDLVGPLAAAQLEFQDQSGKVVAQAKSDDSGYYRVVLSPGIYYYKLQATGFRDEDVGRGVALKISEGFAVYNFSLVRGSTEAKTQPPATVTPIEPIATGMLTGRVYEQLDDRTALGIAAATIHLRGEDSNGQLMEVVSGSDGRFRLRIPAGQWNASVTATGYQTYVDPQPIAMKSNENVTRDFVLAGASSGLWLDHGIRGTVSLQSEGEAAATLGPIDISIHQLVARGALPARIQLAEPGFYEQPLTPGTYQVLAQCQGYRPAMSSPRVVLPGSFTTVDLALQPLPSGPESRRLNIVTTVYERTEDDVVSRRPLPAALVVARLHDQALEDAFREETGADGAAMLTLAQAGDYDLFAYKEGYQPAGIQVHVTPNGVNRAELVLDRVDSPSQPTRPQTPSTELPKVGGRLHVWVVEQPAGQSVQVSNDAMVRMTRNEQSVAAGSTDSRGAFITEILSAGELQVTVTKEGYRESRHSVSIVDRDQLLDVSLLDSSTTRPTEPSPTEPIPTEPSPTEPSPTEPIPTEPSPTEPSPTPTSPQPEAIGVTFDVVADRGDQNRPRLANVDLYVMAHPQADAPRMVAQGKSDQRGQFATRVEPGNYRVMAESPGYHVTEVDFAVGQANTRQQIVMRTANLPPVAEPEPVEPARPDADVDRPDHPSEREGVGVVFTAVAQRGDGQTPPLDNVDIYVLRGGQTVAHGKTDARGQFSIRMMPGSYQVIGERPGYHLTRVELEVAEQDLRRQLLMRSDQLPDGAEPSPGEPTEPRPFDPDMPRGDESPREPGESGVLLTLSTVTGPSGQRQPVPGVEVFVIRSQRTVGQGRSDSRGQYQTRVEPGACVVFAERPGYELTRLDLQIGPQDVARELVMRPMGAPDATRPTTPKSEIEPAPGQLPRPVPPGTQMLTLQMQTVERDDRGVRPVPGPQIRIVRGAGEYAHGQADAAGRFQFRLPAGNYEIQVRREGYREHRESLTLANRNVDRQVVLARLGAPPQPRPPQPDAMVNVQVVERGPDGGLVPIPAARVTINFAGKPVKEGPADRAGAFTTRLNRGLYEVAASKPGYHPNRQRLDLQRGDTVTRVILFREVRPPDRPPLPQVRPIPQESMPQPRVAWQVTVTERGPDGGTFPIPAARVEVAAGQDVLFKGQTDANGRLSTQLPSGKLRLAVAKSGYQTHQATITLQSDPLHTQVTLQRGR